MIFRIIITQICLIEEYRGKFYFEPYNVLYKIIRKYHLENVFELEEELEEFDLKDNEYLKQKFTSDMDKLIKELFMEDIIVTDNSDYNVNSGKVVSFKKKQNCLIYFFFILHKRILH